MRATYLFSLLLTIFIASVYWYQSTAAICPVPLSYRIGEINESFDISNQEALEYILQAEKLWEDKVGRDLFVYDAEADFTIDFVFDERQATADSEEYQRQVLDEQREKNEEVLKIVNSLQQEYESLSKTYEIKVTSYEADLDEYNAEVNRYNDRGGAPEKIFSKLEETRLELNDEARSLTDTTNRLNDLASEINKLSDRGNRLVDSYNQEVGQYNSEFGFEREFTQGDYQGDKIHIYKFSSGNELVTVLAHEFGHALSIDHVEGETSLMYYLMEDTNNTPILSVEDVAAYQVVCGVSESFSQKVRRKVREFLAIF